MKYIIRALLFMMIAYVCIIAGNLWIDLRIETLRQPIVDNALRVGAESAIAKWEAKRTQDETLLEKKRKIRDKKLQEYADKMDEILRME